MDKIRFNVLHDGLAVAERAGTSFHPGRDISICRVRDGGRMGGVIFTNFTHESVVIHSGAWADHWINRDMLFVTFDYPFNQLGVNRIFGHVPEDNMHARRFNEKLGFKYVARIAGVFRHNIACQVMCLERSECRFLDIKPRHFKSNRNVH